VLTGPLLVLGPGRCFPFWQELLGCYAVNSAEDDGKGKAKCGPALEDYYECLHHKKEVCSSRHCPSTLRNTAHPYEATR
jgi:NADH dehydrogenase (ubiquinone) Fe-S protein 5